jgi:hypothetical protein
LLCVFTFLTALILFAYTLQVGIAHGYMEMSSDVSDEERLFHDLAIKIGKYAFSPYHESEKLAAFHHNTSIFYLRARDIQAAENGTFSECADVVWNGVPSADRSERL